LEERLASRLLATYFHSCFLLGLFFNPEDGCDVSPRRRLTSVDCTALYPRRQNFP
jgi:hypothetical protein